MKTIFFTIIGIGLALTATIALAASLAAGRKGEATESDDGAEADANRD